MLVDSASNGGLQNYYMLVILVNMELRLLILLFSSLGFAGECLGQHQGSDQGANLGDGNGYRKMNSIFSLVLPYLILLFISVNETAVMRWAYGDPVLGTCTETIQGGNHFRYWIQDGSERNSGAIFMALSYEEPLSAEHDIIDNGYNLARDWLVGNATSNTTIPTQNLTNGSSYSGQSFAGGYTYDTSVVYTAGFLPNTSNGINHFLTVGKGQNAVDGLVAIMTVKIAVKPQSAAHSSSYVSLSLFRYSPILTNEIEGCIRFQFLLE